MSTRREAEDGKRKAGSVIPEVASTLWVTKESTSCCVTTKEFTGSYSFFLWSLYYDLFRQPERSPCARARLHPTGSLFREIGGDRVMVTVSAKGTEDPHFVEARPSFIKELSECDVYAQMGMELEIGWAPALLREARNGKVLPGTRGYVDAATVIAPLQVPTAPVDRSMADGILLGIPII